MKKLVLLFCVVLSLAGCATILSGSTQSIDVHAINSETHNSLSTANCVIKDSAGNSYYTNTNPGTVLVTKNKGIIYASCKSPGYTQNHTYISESFNPVTLLNILFWPGFIVDAMTGSIQKYPSYVVMPLNKA